MGRSVLPYFVRSQESGRREGGGRKTCQSGRVNRLLAARDQRLRCPRRQTALESRWPFVDSKRLEGQICTGHLERAVKWEAF